MEQLPEHYRETSGIPEDEGLEPSYRRTEYHFIWGTEKHSLLLLEPKLLRCVRGDEYAPYTFDYLVTGESGRTRAYYTPGMREALVGYGARYLDQGFVRRLKDDIAAFGAEFRAFLLHLHHTDCSVLSNDELDDRYGRYFAHLVDAYTYFALTFGWKLDATSSRLHDVLAGAGWDAERVATAASTLSTPTELDEVSAERVAWLETLSDADTPDLPRATILAHVRRFPWLAFNTYDEHDVLDFFQAKYHRHREQGTDCVLAIAALLDAKAALRREQDELLAHAPAEAAHLAQTLQWASRERLAIKWFWAGCEYLALGFLREIAGRIGIGFHEFVHTHKREDIRAFLRDGVRLPRAEAVARLRRISYLVTGGRLYFTSGERAERLEAELVHRDQGGSAVLRGTPAYPGTATGTVRHIKVDDLRTLKADFERFAEGDVLVTTMTQPNILMLMERASAVLTDEGGITSHAAVLCRELRIPCVIGLHTATTTLRDGDQVSVDATLGLVTKLDEAPAPAARQAAARRDPPPVMSHSRPRRPEPVLRLDELTADDVATAGGKAATLGALGRDFPVPPGFCVTTSAYQAFLDHSGIAEDIATVLAGTDPADIAALTRAHDRIRRLVTGAPLPPGLRDRITAEYATLGRERVAVRSSATAEDSVASSFAGQHDSFLDVSGAEAVIDAVKACWASLHTARAIRYRSGREGAEPHLMAVLVQEMVDAEYAGVVFTVHPVTGEGLLVELVRGLGEALVSGQATPNRYVFDPTATVVRERVEVVDVPDDVVHRVARLGHRVAQALGRPTDIEFAVEGGVPLLLQARPITT
jgi:phosphohistidine swiveling domain-containing protein